MKSAAGSQRRGRCIPPMPSGTPVVMRTASTASAGTNMVKGASHRSELLLPPDSPIPSDSRIDPPNATPMKRTMPVLVSGVGMGAIGAGRFFIANTGGAKRAFVFQKRPVARERIARQGAYQLHDAGAYFFRIDRDLDIQFTVRKRTLHVAIAPLACDLIPVLLEGRLYDSLAILGLQHEMPFPGYVCGALHSQRHSR